VRGERQNENGDNTLAQNHPASALSILKHGFIDGQGSYGTDREFSGVWVSDRPLDSNDGAWGEALLRIELPCHDAELTDLEWIEEGKGHREWPIPAAYLNANGAVTLEKD
jgi:hypothetical protein